MLTKTIKAKKKIETDFKATRTRLDEESATKTQQENFAQKLEEEIAKLKEDLDAEVKNKALIERVHISPSPPPPPCQLNIQTLILIHFLINLFY